MVSVMIEIFNIHLSWLLICWIVVLIFALAVWFILHKTLKTEYSCSAEKGLLNDDKVKKTDKIESKKELIPWNR
jgi:hypothetical protein